MLEGLPTKEDLLEQLKDVRDAAAQVTDDPDTGEVAPIDVRLQVHEGRWRLWDGDSSFDTDHRGYWGFDDVAGDDTDAELESVAVDLIEQVRDDAAANEEKGRRDAAVRRAVQEQQDLGMLPRAYGAEHVRVVSRPGRLCMWLGPVEYRVTAEDDGGYTFHRIEN